MGLSPRAIPPDGPYEKMNTKSLHTPGAIRASRAIQAQVGIPGITASLAAIIDHETAALELLETLKTARAAVYEFTRAALIDAGNSRPGSGILALDNPVILEIDNVIRRIDPTCAEVVTGDNGRAAIAKAQS